ncbi:MAG TPA: UBP-type zinc finger domain-containing protein [Acidimicrobiia bacterium]|nr:UBP-type zinc finger domain-containing protein [Acidimicrobiia bacterium]
MARPQSLFLSPFPSRANVYKSTRPRGGELLEKLINPFLRKSWTGTFRQRRCSHLSQIREVDPEADLCRECVSLGDTWPALRMCLTCGHVGCCEEAENQHAFRHFEETGHPLVRPHRERGMNWVWCYIDAALLPRHPSAGR